MLAPTTAAAATGFLALSAVLVWVAALTPGLYPVWFRRDALGVIGRRPVLWRVNAVLFLASATAALVGLALVFGASTDPFAAPALLLLCMGTALWAIDTGLRLSVVDRVARHRDAYGERLLELLQSWSNAIWYHAAAVLILAFAAMGVVILSTGVLDAWAGWMLLGSALVSTVVFALTRDAAPIVIYLPVLPLAAATLQAALAGR